MSPPARQDILTYPTNFLNHDPILHVFHRTPMQTDSKHHTNMPNRMRPSSEPVYPMRALPRSHDDTLGEMGGVEN